MTIWAGEINELEKLYESFKGHLPDIVKELEHLIRTDDANVVMLYSRRCLEVIVTDLCECELKRPRKTEPLKGIIDKLNSEEKVPSHIITSMHSLNSLSTYGTHPKDFDPEQVKPVLNNLAIIIKWYLKYKDFKIISKTKEGEEKFEKINYDDSAKVTAKPIKRSLLIFTSLILILIVVSVIVVLSLRGKKSGDITKLEKSIAVLPFKNESPNDSTTFFIDGIMEDILTNLQTIEDLRVIFLTSVEQYRNPTKSIAEIAKELGVNFIVVGSGQKYGNTIKLRVRLIMAAKESQLWAKPYENEIKDAKDIFSIQSQIAQAIALELEAVITPREKELIKKIPTDNLEAYEAYKKGQFYLRKFTPNDLDTAMNYFELAKKIDPEYALAYTGICDVWAYRQQIGLVSPAEGNQNSMAAVMKAIELDSTCAEAQYSLGHKKTWGMYDWKGGESGFKKSLAINPNNAMTHAVYSHLLNIVGRPEEAMEHIEIAVKLDPMNPFILTFYGIDLQFVRRYDEAIKVFQDAMKIEPGYSAASGQIAWTLFLVERYKEAYEQLKVAYSNDPEISQAIEQGYTKDGWKGSLISYNKVCEKRDNWSPCDIAGNYALIGDNDKAMNWLEKAYEVHDPNLPYLLSPYYDLLRNDLRFQDLACKMNLPYK